LFMAVCPAFLHGVKRRDNGRYLYRSRLREDSPMRTATIDEMCPA
jgi:hypothetical protein